MIELSPPLHLDIALVVTFSTYCYNIFLSSQLFLESITLFPISISRRDPCLWFELCSIREPISLKLDLTEPWFLTPGIVSLPSLKFYKKQFCKTCIEA